MSQSVSNDKTERKKNFNKAGGCSLSNIKAENVHVFISYVRRKVKTMFLLIFIVFQLNIRRMILIV